MVAARIVISDDVKGNTEYFNSLRYPDDLELMYMILDEALQIGQFPFINSVSGRVIATGDAELSYLAALSALFSRNHSILANVGTTLDDVEPRPEEENYVNSLLIANSLLEQDKQDLSHMLDRLNSSADLDNIVRFYFLAVGTTLKDPDAEIPDSVYADLSQRIRLRLPDGVKSRYLISTALAIPDEDSTLAATYNQAREELIISMMEQGHHNPEDINWLLAIYFQSGRMEERVPLLRTGIGLFPDQHSWFNDLGYTLLIQGGDPDEAAGLIFEALRMDPENDFYLDSIAWYYYLKGDFEHAREFISGVMDMENMPAEIAYHIALIHLKLNDFDTATLYMRKAASTEGDSDFGERAKRALQLWGIPESETEQP
jgi:tetratricopeptide (TPR) repeat protein